jgi:hypothetical protein
MANADIYKQPGVCWVCTATSSRCRVPHVYMRRSRFVRTRTQLRVAKIFYGRAKDAVRPGKHGWAPWNNEHKTGLIQQVFRKI